MSIRTQLLFSLGISLLIFVPWLVLLVLNHGGLSVPPELADDSVYYYSRIESVVTGHPFIGNPYLKEHAGEMASAFFGADWIASIPRLIDIPLLPSILVNLFLWTSLFSFLSLWLLALAEVRGKARLLGSGLLFVSAFWLLERPVAMQVVFPSYLFFLASVLWWLKKPDSVSRTSLLVVSSGLTFYIYTYLWQIVAIVLAGLHVLFLTKNRKRFVSLLAADAAIAVLAAPMAWYTYLQVSHPLYWETVARIGFVATRTFGSAGLVNVALLTSALAAFFFTKKRPASEPLSFFVIIVSSALLVASFSNVFTNKDLETAVHIGRFIELWGGFLAVLAIASYRYSKLLRSDVVGLAAALLLVGYIGYGFVHTGKATLQPVALAPEQYTPVLSWMSEHIPQGSVVLADDSLASYIPSMTHNFVLFHPNAELYLVSNTELENRYLASRVFQNLTMEEIETDYRKYAGAGNAVHRFKIHNREVRLCHLLKQNTCGTFIPDAITDKGTAYFEGLYSRYKEMQKNPDSALQAYGVQYIVVDTKKDDWKINHLNSIATVGEYSIYRVAK